MSSPLSGRRGLIASVSTLALATSSLALGLAAPATASPAGDALVLSEVYGGGGNAGATLTNDFVELYNPTDAPISVDGMSVQYRSAGNNLGGIADLAGAVPAGGHYLVEGDRGTGGTTELPTPDASGPLSMSGTKGIVLLAGTTDEVDPTAAGGDVVDLVGYGSASVFEGSAPAPGLSNSTAAARGPRGGDTDDNAADLTAVAPTPTSTHGDGGGEQPPTEPPAPGEVVTIAEIQGTGAASPLEGRRVTTTGVVTARYATGGLDGLVVQTPGTGRGADATPGASDGIFVNGGSLDEADYAVGDSLELSGTVAERFDVTEIVPAGPTDVSDVHPSGDVTPLATALPATDAEREAHESELLAPQGGFTVTNTYATNTYAEIGLAAGDTPLVQPTEVEDAQTGDVAGVEADNAARAVTLDDGASTNFTRGAGADTPVPYLTRPDGSPRPVRVGAPVTFTAPVVLSYGFGAWRFQPTSPLTSDDTLPVDIENTRTDAPEAVPGDVRLATFNVLNYFATTGEEFAAGPGSCTYYTDRAGNPITTNRCEPDGPRGAADQANLERQQAKIVAAINTLGADVVSLEEIENSVKFGKDRDAALATLVEALNSATGSPTWDYVPSPAPEDLPATADQDVIRTGFIYRPAALETVGASRVLVDEAFSNARQPLAQAFKPVGARDAEAFTVIVNHFKSKGSGVDDGTGQGNANPDRVAQAQALLGFADDVEADSGVARTFLTGDFNAYSAEDPIQVLEEGGYTRVESDTEGEETYSYSGLSGSLDHVLANDAALGDVRGADVWNISSGESLAFEYSRYNTNVTDFYAPDPFRASDHDPEIVGISLPAAGPTGDVAELNLLSVNDFHGRIFEDTVKWAGTVEQLRAQGGEDDTLFVGAGDLIGASLFASNVAQDQPTIDVMNALGLDASAVGNHEFDRGWIDLRDRVIGADGQRNAMWDYLGANVYQTGTTDPVLPEFALFTVDGVDVAVVGAVTEETAELVAPSGIEDITFGDPTDAVNRVAARLSDGDDANGEADVVVASFHAGAVQGEDTYEENVARGGEFADMADLDPAVDVIFNGHTHQVYAYDAPVTGGDLATRPILQTGSYADNVGQVTLEVDRSTGEVLAYDARNVARTDAADDELAATYPRVAAVQQIVDDALAAAAEIGDQPVAEVTDDVTTAFSGGAYGPDGYAGGTRDDRGSESTLGDLVGNALRDGLDFGDPDLGVTNPGGLRAELLYAGDTATNPENTDGVVTYAEANSVLPFGNTVALVDLTGAQLKDVLEQQWQPDGADRPYLQLGLSDNVRVTADPDRDRGDRITSVSIDGEPLDAGATYTVSTFGFLAGGGDNFEAFTEGSTTDTGVLDAELWRDYLASASPISPDFARQQVQVTGAPTAGAEATLVVSDLDLTSLGSPANTEVTATLVDGATESDLVTVPVVDGTAEVDVTVPADVAPGAVVRLVAAPSGTTVDVPVEVVEQVETTLEASAERQVYGRRGAVDVTVGPEGSGAGGEVTLLDGQDVLATADVVDGSATLRVPRGALEPGRYDLRVAYAGDATHTAATTTVRLRVVRATPEVTVTATPEVLKFKKDRTTVRTVVGARGFEPTGFVVLYVDGSPQAVAELEDGRASFRAGPFRRTGEHTLGVLYLGDEHATRAADETTVTVQKRNPRRR